MHQLGAIQKAIDCIEERLTEPLSIEAVARKVGMSLWHFQRTFTAMVGEPVGSYIRRRRLTEAARCLRSSERPILDVALEYQFESHEAFTRSFKSEMAVLPSAWRSGRVAIRRGRPRARISLELLQQRFKHMNLTPELVNLPPQDFMGLQARFISAASPDTNNLKIIPKLWEDFFQRIQEIPTNEPHICYGLADCPEAQGIKADRPDEAIYLASSRVDRGAKPPRGMTVWSSPGGTFAKFTHVGKVDRLGETFSYIYGKWFSTSGYDRAEGPDLERYDNRFDPRSDKSVLEIYVPVEKAKAGQSRTTGRK